ncbi:MAG TPA: hypothetical protein VFV73_39140 [Streptosporangiaceae bacterium]|nr:hypothetical protein [Streptosporangiaceae bacterium]
MIYGFRRPAISLLAAGVTLSLAIVSGCSHSGPVHAVYVRDGHKVEVEAPGQAGTPGFTGLPALSPGAVPAGLKMLTQPVHISTKPFTGPATLTFGYDPAGLPQAAQPARGLTVLAYVPSVSAWLPAGGTVNAAAHTVTVATTHFSDWALAVTDPDELAEEEAQDHRLSRSIGGKLGALIAGDQDSLDCSPANLLLAAQMSDDAALAPKLCEEVLADGSYRLQYINTTGTPQLIHLPDGFTEHDPSRELDPLLGRLLAGGPGTAVVPDGGSLDVRFPGSAVTPATQITGDTDWTVYVITTIREALAAALGLKPGDSKMLSKLDDALTAADLYDCASAAPEKVAEAHSPAGKVKALAELAASCGKDFAVHHAVKAVASLAGIATTTTERFLEGRVDPLLAVPGLMELGRGEVTGLGQGMFSAAGLDTRLTIVPARVMNFAEASALPATDLANPTECQPPPAGVPLPAGAPPGIQCLAAVSADLDGDGQPDRLLVWESQPPDDIGGGPGDAPPQMGAVAYLDDGTFHLPEEAPSSWKLPGSTAAEELRPVQVVSLGDDRRQQVLVTVVVGANTNWQAVFIIGQDRRLHALRAADGSMVVLTDGGGAAYSSGYGCVDSSSQPLVAVENTTTVRGPDGLDHGYTWSIDYYRLLDLQWTHVATRTGKAASVRTRPPSDGSDCSNPDPAHRGPEIGTP